jgi:hypothetical protein
LVFLTGNPRLLRRVLLLRNWRGHILGGMASLRGHVFAAMDKGHAYAKRESMLPSIRRFLDTSEVIWCEKNMGQNEPEIINIFINAE